MTATRIFPHDDVTSPSPPKTQHGPMTSQRPHRFQAYRLGVAPSQCHVVARQRGVGARPDGPNLVRSQGETGPSEKRFANK
jgi:hypothetical protein